MSHSSMAGSLDRQFSLSGTSSIPSTLQRTRSFRSSKRKSNGYGNSTAMAIQVKQQLSDQLRSLDQRLECQVGMVMEVQDFFRRLAEVEMEYSKSLDKVSKNFMARHKTEKQKREQWSMYSTHACWSHLVNNTRKQSKDHSIISDIYGSQMVTRLQDTVEDLRRIFGNCRDIAVGTHEDISKGLGELQTEMKSYHLLYGDSQQAEEKFKLIETQRNKVLLQASKASKKIKALDKDLGKKQDKFHDARIKANKVRNEYLISLDATNASLHKYFTDDLPLLIDCMEYGYHNSMQRNMMMYKSCLENVQKSTQTSMEGVNKCVQDLEPAKDKQNFLDSHSITFTLPKKFDLMPHRGDTVTQVSAEKEVMHDLQVRFTQIQKRLDMDRLESEETWKSVEAADTNLISMIHQNDYSVDEQFIENPVPKSPLPVDSKKKRLDLEKYYFEKFRVAIGKSNVIARTQAKYELLKKAMGDTDWSVGSRPVSMPAKPMKARRLGKAPIVGQLKVFGTNLEEYIEATKSEIPLVVRSCIRAINLYGLYHEGIFRVSGLQSEINDIKAAFEKGEDPLADIEDGNSINSIAAVLKLFFRELQEPLFPQYLFDALIDCNRNTKTADTVASIKENLHMSLSKERRVVMRYLFAFLNHLSEKYDENLMAPYNLAVCFGPTLLPIPSNKDQVVYQNNVNELIKLIIVHQDKIFPADEEGPVYEKIVLDKMDGDNLSDEENIGEEEETDVIEAVAAYAFNGRSEKELSFEKGDTLLLFKRISPDWWEGAFSGRDGIIPDKYVTRKSESELSSISERPKYETRKSVDGSLQSSMVTSKTDYMSTPSMEKSPSQPNLQPQVSVSKVTEISSVTMTAQPLPSSPPPMDSGTSFTDGTPVTVAVTPTSHPLRDPDSSVESDLVTSLQELSNLTQSMDLDSSQNTPLFQSAPASSLTTSSIESKPVSSFNKQAPPLSAMSKSETAQSRSSFPQASVTPPQLSSPVSGPGPASPRQFGAVSSSHHGGTPDLVLDLPDAAKLKKSTIVNVGGDNSSDSPAKGDTADTFANTEQNTVLRNPTKSASMPRGISPNIASLAASTVHVVGEGRVLPGQGPTSFKRSSSAKVQSRDGKPMAVAEPIPHDVIRSVKGHGSGPNSPVTTPQLTPSSTPLATPTEPKSFEADLAASGGFHKPKPAKIPPPIKSKPVKLPPRTKRFDGATHF